MSLFASRAAQDGSAAHTRIKLCGMTRGEDVRLAAALGVDAIGLVFAERSARRLAPEQGAALRAEAGDARVVALLMDTSDDAIRHVVDAVHPDVLQFHGDESDADCARWGLPFLKAIAMRGIAAADLPSRLALYPSASGFVLDGHAPGAPGGQGERFDWSVLGGGVPGRGGAANHAMARPWLLAGGLEPGNVGNAIQGLRPWGVDVASGIEVRGTPGMKDPAAMRAFVAAVRRADAERDQRQELHADR